MKNDLPAALGAGTGTDAATLSLRLRQVRHEGVGIHSFEFVDPDDGELPPFEAGAHVDLHLPDGTIRQYSLCNDPAERHRYVIAVLRDENGRGGSKAVHATLHVGELVHIGRPRNNFRLADDARRIVLLAGGIGVTPLKAMAHALAQAGAPFELHYCARGPEFAAFGDDLRALGRSGQVHRHFDGGDPRAGLDIVALLREPGEGAHLYYCGPPRFMKACAAAAAHWEPGTVHFEHFQAPVEATPSAPPGAADNEGRFVIRIHSTGQEVDVGPEESIVEALAAAGISIETSCQSGLCGTCKVGYLAGEVEHKDFILSDEEHAHCLTACVSRATGGVLELDL